MNLYAILALDLANERAREARNLRRAEQFDVDRPSFIRRALASLFAAVSRGSAAAARRVDAQSTDDFSRRLAPTE